MFEEALVTGSNCTQMNIRRWDAVMLNVRRHVLVMRERGGQVGVIGMGKVVVPIQLLSVPIDLITIGRDQPSLEIEFLHHTQLDALGENYFPLGNTSIWADRPYGQR